MPNFIQKCVSGDASLEDIDNYIEHWHKETTTLNLHTYLGMSRSEYELWVTNPDILPFVVESHRTQKE